MFESLNTQHKVNLKVIIILQNISILELRNEINCQEIVLSHINTGFVSISKARNLGLQYISENKIEYDFLMFPDDDCWFEDNFFVDADLRR